MCKRAPRWMGWIAGAGAMLLVAACQSPPAAAPVPAAPAPIAPSEPAKGLSPAQMQGLKAMGFVEEAQGWQFDISDSKLLFDTAQDALSAKGRAVVADIARGLKKLGLERLRLEGHTDNVGGLEFNKGLGQRRAQHVAQQFVQQGFAEAQIERLSFGPTKPVADNATAEGRAQNRRVTLIVLAE